MSSEEKDYAYLYYEDLYGNYKNGLENMYGNQKVMLKMLTRGKNPYAIVDYKSHVILIMNEEMDKLGHLGQEYEFGMSVEQFLLGKESQYVYDFESILDQSEAIFPRSQGEGDLILHVNHKLGSMHMTYDSAYGKWTSPGRF